MLLTILNYLWLLGVPVLAQLPACGNSAFIDAVELALCGFLDLNCICNSNVFARNLGQNVPYACNTTAQSSIFSYVDAACSQVGGSTFNLAATAVTDVPITASTGPATVSVTVTTTASDAHNSSTPVSADGSSTSDVTTTASDAHNSSTPVSADGPSTSDISASSTGLSTGAKVGIAVGIVGGLTAILFFSFCAYRRGRAAAMMNQKNLSDNRPFMQTRGDPTYSVTEMPAQPKAKRHELMPAEELAELS